MSRSAQQPRWASVLGALALAGSLVAGGAGRASAQSAQATPPATDYFSEQKSNRLTYRVEGERTRNQQIALWSLAGATVLVGGLGVVFNLESRDAADEVRAFTGEHTGEIYTHALDQRRQDAETYGTVATVLYAAGSALAVSTIVAFIVTSPPDEVREYRSESDSRVSGPFVVPVQGGAVLGTVWTY